jgi:hypothetical protein
MGKAVEVIDDLSSGSPGAVTGSGWVLISDRVMGGVSSGSVRHETVAGRPAIRMRGGVSLENKGGFLQIALDLGEAGGPVDASAWTGIQFDVIGNSQTYNLHLRTTDIQRPWESYRQSFVAPTQWARVRLPFTGFVPHRTERPLRVSCLRRIGLVAIGREFDVDIAISDIRFYDTTGVATSNF